MIDIDKDRPAFPTQHPRIDDAPYWTELGMTLRDYFAAHALAVIPGDSAEPDSVADLARDAYRIADAMMAERTKP